MNPQDLSINRDAVQWHDRFAAGAEMLGKDGLSV